MGRGRFAYLDHDGPIAFAHRGGAGDHPENTLAAFAAAIALGYRYLETDVHLTRDGVVIAFHDDRLDRVTDGRGLVADLDFATIARARVAGVAPIPTLDALFESFPEARINIDPKSDAVVEPLIDAIRRHGASARVGIGSFDGRRTARVRAAFDGRICTSPGPRDVAALYFTRLGLPWSGADFGCVQIPTRQGPFELATPRLINAAHARGLQVHVWTIDDPDEMNRLLDLGVDGVMTDRLEVLRDVLRARGQWRGP